MNNCHTKLYSYCLPFSLSYLISACSVLFIYYLLADYYMWLRTLHQQIRKRKKHLLEILLIHQNFSSSSVIYCFYQVWYKWKAALFVWAKVALELSVRMGFDWSEQWFFTLLEMFVQVLALQAKILGKILKCTKYIFNIQFIQSCL
jgi:hypothetical protein